MSEPLTPPPSSAIEIQDAARSDPQQSDSGAEPIVTDPPTQEPAQVAAAQSHFSTTYHFLFPSLAELAEKGDYKELVDLAERGDLNGENDDHISRLLVTAPLVLSYLILDNLPPARFALLRLPTPLSKHSLAQGLLTLLSAVWEKHYDQVYTRAGDIITLVQKEAPVANFDLGSLISKLVHVFVEAFQRKTFALLSKAYSSIPLSVAQVYLGMQADQLLSVAVQHKWSYDQGSQVLSPVAPNVILPLSKDNRPGSSILTFKSVADSLIIESR